MGLFDRFRRADPAPQRRHIEAAGQGRRGRGHGTFGPVNSEVAAAASIVRSRARSLYVNNGLIRNALDNLTTSTTGTGCRPNCPDEEVMRRFESWVITADYDGRTDFYGLQRILALHMVRDGEGLAILHVGDDGELQVQVLPPEHLDESKTAQIAPRHEIFNGVEFMGGRIVAYWILPQRPTSEFTDYAPSVRVDAADVIHVFEAQSAGQVRGLSRVAPAVIAANELDQLTDALLVQAKVAAMFAGFLTDLNNVSGVPFDGEQIGSTLEGGITPGAIQVLPSGFDLKLAEPDSTKDAPAMVRMGQQAVASALGMPEHLVNGDLSKANYSSLRAGLLPWRARIEQIQYGTLVPQMLAPIWRRWLALEVAAGRLDVSPDMTCEWIMPRWLQVDPAKDVAAVKELLALGLMSRSQAISELGWSPRRTGRRDCRRPRP